MKLQRVFIALPLDKPAAQFLCNQVKPFRGENIRAVAQDNLHLTLAFLGSITPAQLNQVSKSLPALARLQPNALQISQIKPFPKKSSNIIAAIVEESEHLQSLYKATAKIIGNAGIKADLHPVFRPHITAARIRGHSGRKQTGNMIDIRLQPPLRFTPGYPAIFEGAETTEGYRYQCLFRIEESAGSSSG